MEAMNKIDFDYFTALFKQSKENCMLTMNSDGVVTNVNDAFTTCFGYDQKEIIGKYCAVLFTHEDQKRQLPEKEVAKVLSIGQANDNNYLVRKDKSITWVSGESVSVKNDHGDISIVKIIQDIQQQKISEASIANLNYFNENILRSIDDVVLELDSNMKVVTANRSFYQLFNSKPTAATSINFAELVKPYDTNNEFANLLREALRDNKGFINHPLELEIIADDKRIYSVNCSPLMRPDNVNNLLMVIHDNTVLKQAEREREDILGFVAHELRNPLANIVLCNEIMAHAIRENKLDEVNSMLQRSKNNVMRLNKMIAELYDATRINSGNLVLEITEFNLKDMISEAIDTIQILQPAYNIIVEGEMNFNLQGDRYRLIQVITNYLINGIKYSNGKTDVILRVEHDNDHVIISVKDEGLGITRQQLPHIFERFFRAERTRNLEGIGLGLYLCKQIIQQHKGKVWAESEEGKGSVFYFSIPRNPVV